MQTAIALLATLAVILFSGVMARRVVGQRLLRWFEALIERIPLASTIYGSARQLLDILQTKPDGTQRVVLIDFPHTEMKSIGFVTRVMREHGTGRELAAVYVPTTPNPTSGYLEIVPVEKITPTDWTVDQAMSFIISGGAVARRAAEEEVRRLAALRLVRTDDPRARRGHVQVLAGQFAAGEIGDVEVGDRGRIGHVVGVPPVGRIAVGAGLPLAVPARGGDRDHRCIRAGIAHAGLALVAGRGDDDHALRDRVVDGGLLDGVQRRSAQAHVDHHRRSARARRWP